MITLEQAKQKYGKADPNKKTVCINWDAIDSLPDELEPIIGEFKFDPKKLTEYFTNVGTEKKPSWYPKTEVMYEIAKKAGIIGDSQKTVEWICEEVNINPLLMKNLEDEPTMRRIKTGARVTKRSKKLTEDNTYMLSTPESNEFNFFNRACLEFLNDEQYTNGKYNTSIKRQKRLLDLEKFAIQQAETKAFCKTIRVLAGMPTGYTTQDLKDGALVFMKFIKSKRIQKLETAARIDAIRQGNTKEIENISQEVFGSKEIETIIKSQEKKEEFVSSFDPPKEETEQEKLKNVLCEYIDDKKNNKKIIAKRSGAIDIIETAINNFQNESIETLKNLIERIEQIPGVKKIDHNFLQEDDGGLF